VEEGRLINVEITKVGVEYPSNVKAQPTVTIRMQARENVIEIAKLAPFDPLHIQKSVVSLDTETTPTSTRSGYVNLVLADLETNLANNLWLIRSKATEKKLAAQFLPSSCANLAKFFSISVPDYGQKGVNGGNENACFWLSLAKLTGSVIGVDFKPESKQVRQAMETLRVMAAAFARNLTVCADLLKEAVEFALGTQALEEGNVQWSLSALLWLVSRQFIEDEERLEGHRVVFKAVSSKAFSNDEGEAWESQEWDHKNLTAEKATALLSVIDAFTNFVDGDAVTSFDAKLQADQRVQVELSEKIPQVQNIWLTALTNFESGFLCGNFGVKVADKMMRAARILNIATLVSGHQTGCKLAFHKGFDGSLPTVVVAYQEYPSLHYQPVTHFGEGDGLLVINSMSEVGMCISQLGGAWKQRIQFRGNAKGHSNGTGVANKTGNVTKSSTVSQSTDKVDGEATMPLSKTAKKKAAARASKAKKALALANGLSEIEKASLAKAAAEKAAAEAKKVAEKAEQDRAAATEKWQEVGGGKKSSPTVASAVPQSILPITEVMLFDAIKGVSPAAVALKNRVSMALSRKVHPSVIMRALHSRGEFCVLGECCNVKASNCMRKHEMNPVSLETVAQGQKQLLQKVQSMETKLKDATPNAQQQVVGRTWSNVVSPWAPPPVPPMVSYQPTTSTPSATTPAVSNTRDPLIMLRDLLAGGLMDRLLALA